MPGARSQARAQRDTDADWRELGRSEPYWGVLSNGMFLSENITDESIEAFYACGRPYIDEIVGRLEAVTGSGPSGRGLDFGCGVGRLTEAMAEHVEAVVGLDVSPGMLEVARRRAGKATYLEALPEGMTFDWINSFIVFQHIPPDRGEAILADLLGRLNADGAVSLQFAVWRDEAHQWPKKTDWRSAFDSLRHRRWIASLPVGHILMYDYDLSRLLRLLNEGGVEEMSLVSTHHDGHHGVIILGRKRPSTHKG
ncbi:MAG: class I SAM-dependent methyltransferase [Caulobacterales bacterium]|jgi:SAM-dependent methyltransferase